MMIEEETMKKLKERMINNLKSKLVITKDPFQFEFVVLCEMSFDPINLQLMRIQN